MVIRRANATTIAGTNLGFSYVTGKSEMENFEVGEFFSGRPEQRGAKNRAKELRELLGLPLTKQLVYYPSRYATKSIDVVSVEIVGFIHIEHTDEYWYDLSVWLENDTNHYLNSWYLSEMQNPKFSELMRKQDRGEYEQT